MDGSIQDTRENVSFYSRLIFTLNLRIFYWLV